MNVFLTSKKSIDNQSGFFSELLAATPRLASKDYTLWGKEAEAESAIRLNWVDLPTASMDLIPKLDALVEWARKNNLSHFILCGMGGSSLGPEVLAKASNKEGKVLIVLDSTDPSQIIASTPKDLSRVGIIVGSKSGSTVETASQKAYFEKLLRDAGLDPRNHFVIITDPGSPFDISSREDGYFVVNADPHVGGRFSVLTAFGLVPSALLGMDVQSLLHDAHVAAQSFTRADSPAVKLAVAILEANQQNISFFDSGSTVPGLSDWIEQLIAESTGKEEKGFFPIAVANNSEPVAGPALRIGFDDGDFDISVKAPLGAQFILWEWVTSLIAIKLRINPFDQPNVQDAKTRCVALLNDWGNKVPELAPVFESENLQVFSKYSSATLEGQVRELLQSSPHYIATMAYLARGVDDAILPIRALIANVSGVGTSFGWGPRFLHSTGQFHKGGPKNGAFIQITGDSEIDLQIPGKSYSFQTLLMAQALGDGQALAENKLPLLRFHLRKREAGIEELLELFTRLA
jgi:glucose-6-phosphate isomerase